MKKVYLLILSLFLLHCSTNTQIDERELLRQKLEAFQFLSKYHHQLHIMIGEENGDIKKAYDEFSNAVNKLNNTELLAIKNAIGRIRADKLSPSSEYVKRLDYLVDYYQSGLSMQIEAIFRGHGHLQVLDFDNVLTLYDKIND